MKFRPVLTVLLIMVAVFSGSMAGYLFGVSATREEIAPQVTTVSQKKSEVPVKAEIPEVKAVSEAIPEKEKAESTKKPSESYILREKDGKVALFIKDSTGKENLHSSYDVPIMFLPKSDRDALKKGIPFNSLDEIMKFAEDYVG